MELAKDAAEWNSIVERSPFSVLHHRHEVCVNEDNAIPLVITDGEHRFLFPFSITTLLNSFGLASSAIYFYASILPEDEDVTLLPKALDRVYDFLADIQIDYLSACAPSFYPKEYVSLMNSWFKRRKAGFQVLYAHMIPIHNISFDEIWRSCFEKHARNQARKAEKEGVVVIKIDTVDKILEWMDDIYGCNVSALQRQGRWGAYPDSVKEALRTDLISTKKRLQRYFNIYGAIYRGRLIAYMMVQSYKVMQITKAMSHTDFLNKCPNDILLSHIIKEACECGFSWVAYGFDRVKRNGAIPSLYRSLQDFKFKFGFEEIPVFVYRLGLSFSGKTLQHLFSAREFIVTRSASFPEPFRVFLQRLYAPRRRRLFAFSHL